MRELPFGVHAKMSCWPEGKICLLAWLQRMPAGQGAKIAWRLPSLYNLSGSSFSRAW
jgi:hypothetical protein